MILNNLYLTILLYAGISSVVCFILSLSTQQEPNEPKMGRFQQIVNDVFIYMFMFSAWVTCVAGICCILQLTGLIN